jgi:protein phosphatase
MLDLVFGQATDPGKVQTSNEDAMGIFIPDSRQQARSHGYLFAVADGVGGLDLGEIASSTAISVLTDEFPKAQPDAMLISLLPQLVQHANAAVHDRTLAPEFRGKKMATTVVACALRHDQAVVSHVGDSRCYLVRKGIAKQITHDHGWANERKRTGLIKENGESGESEESEVVWPGSRDVPIRSLGPEMFVFPDTTALTLQSGDVLVLCSDGLYGELPEHAIAAIVSQNKPVDCLARELVARAVEIDGNDNTTAQVIRIRSVEQVGMYRYRPS